MPLKPKELVRLLKKNGFKVVSQHGSHLKLRNAKTNVVVIVPMHSREIKKGLEIAIKKQAGILKEKSR